MPESSYRIRWKGRTEGPYTREEIRGRIADGELSLLHRVEVSGNWIGLGEFLSPQKPPSTESAPAPARSAPAPTVHAPVRHAEGIGATDESAAILRNGYLLCGLCFVFPLAATVPAVAVAMRLRRRGEARESRAQLALAALLTLLGILFWLAVKSAYARGMI